MLPEWLTLKISHLNPSPLSLVVVVVVVVVVVTQLEISSFTSLYSSQFSLLYKDGNAVYLEITLNHMQTQLYFY